MWGIGSKCFVVILCRHDLLQSNYTWKCGDWIQNIRKLFANATCLVRMHVYQNIEGNLIFKNYNCSFGVFIFWNCLYISQQKQFKNKFKGLQNTLTSFIMLLWTKAIFLKLFLQLFRNNCYQIIACTFSILLPLVFHSSIFLGIIVTKFVCIPSCYLLFYQLIRNYFWVFLFIHFFFSELVW